MASNRLPTTTRASGGVRTWHHGLMARWWAEFCTDGEDIAYFVRLARQYGGPVLDAGCGSGRLLVPLAAAGIEVDGSDASVDMLQVASAALEAQGLSAGLHACAMHELHLEPGYRTVLMCGAFGLGGDRVQDQEGLKRVHRLIAPGGTLVLDHHLPNFEARSWGHWLAQPSLPRQWPVEGDRRRCADGTALELRSRQIAFNPLELTTTLEMRIDHYAEAGEWLTREQQVIDINLYFKPEIEHMLRVAGFSEIRVTGSLEPRPAQPWRDERLVFHAQA